MLHSPMPSQLTPFSRLLIKYTEEMLLLQGIPANDLLLTKETEDNLKDLAGNAMSSTVVGCSILCAL